jgi:hypothetical protein
VCLSLLPSGSATLSGPVTGITNSSGLVTFGTASNPLTIDKTGYYQLQASANNFQSVTSPVFLIADTVTSCKGNSCSDSVNNVGDFNSSASSVVVNASGDFLSMGAGGFQYSCPGYTTVSGIVATDVWQSNGNSIAPTSAQTNIVISKQAVQLSPNNGAPFYQVCYASTSDFTQLGGGLAPAPPAFQTVPGVTFFVGLLPDCGNTNPPPVPCVISRNKTKSGQVVVSFYGTGDYFGTG